MQLLKQIDDPQAELPDEDDQPEQLRGLYQRALELVRVEFEEPTWRAFERVVIDGRSPVDVAEEFDVTPAAIRKSKSRVLRRLREQLGELID